MTKAGKSFELSIKDAEGLLSRFDSEKNSEIGQNLDALKRSGIVMALAAWETYVKDRFKEEIKVWLININGSPLGNFVKRRVDEDLKRFYNPNSARIKLLFKSYFEVDITSAWKWDNYHPPQARQILDGLISKRGDAAHQANTEPNKPHVITRDELEKAIRFVKGLVRATEKFSITK